MTPVAEPPVADRQPSITSSSLSAYGKARATVQGSPLSSEDLRKTDAYWRACKYLALGMIYLKENPRLKEALGRSILRTACSVIGVQALDSRSSISI